VTVDPRLEELAQRTPNFGFLLEHEAVLVGYGATAVSMVSVTSGRPTQRDVITWLRDPDAEDDDNLQPPEMIAQEIAEDIQTALNEFTAVAKALEAVKPAQQEGTT
jgi:hypothetical protein